MLATAPTERLCSTLQPHTGHDGWVKSPVVHSPLSSGWLSSAWPPRPFPLRHLPWNPLSRRPGYSAGGTGKNKRLRPAFNMLPLFSISINIKWSIKYWYSESPNLIEIHQITFSIHSDTMFCLIVVIMMTELSCQSLLKQGTRTNSIQYFTPRINQT